MTFWRINLILLLFFVFGKGVFASEINIIGDSLIVGSQKYIRNLLFEYDLNIDAKEGRHFKSAFELVEKIKPGSIVVINLFNNSAVDYREIETLIQILTEKGSTIVFINTHVQRSWREYNNRNLQLIKLKYPQVYLLDWEKAMSVLCYNVNCLRSDGVHFTQEGSFNYALALYFVISQAIKENYAYKNRKP